MPSRNDDLYKLFIDYIQEDNKWKEAMNKTVSSIEYQTKLTNGRINKIEPVVDKLDGLSKTAAITKKVDWKWLGAGLAFAQFLAVAAFYFLIDWLRSRFIN